MEASFREASRSGDGPDPLVRWTLSDREELLQTPVFAVARWQAHLRRRDHRQPMYVIEAPDWVNVIPLTDDQRIVMIRQYRAGTDEVTLEIPGGAVDDSDISPARAAERELLEETGYTAQELHCLGCVAPNPAIQNNRCHCYLASGVNLSADGQRLDPGEDIDVVLVHVDEVTERIRRGEVSHALVLAAFFFWRSLDRPQP